MSNSKKKRKIYKGSVITAIAIIVLIVMAGVVIRAFWYKRQCDIVYSEVNSSFVKSGMKIYAEYNGQKVEISQPNINRVINSVTDRMVLFTSEKEMPEGEPIILEFGDVLLMEIYQGERYDVFVKHKTDEDAKYYIIKDTCNFQQLRKMISLDEWAYPNILMENK